MAIDNVIDADGHILEPDGIWRKYLEPPFLPMAPKRVRDTLGRVRLLEGGELLPYVPVTEGVRARPGAYKPLPRLKEMDEEGIHVSAIFPSMGLTFPGIKELPVIAAISRAYNNWLHDYCSAAPERLIGVAMVPQMDVRETMVEARRAVTELGFKGVWLRPNPIGGRTLDHPVFDPLWSLLEELNVPALIHEGTSMNIHQAGLDRYADNYLFMHVISHPHEQQMACLGLICGRVLERHPRLRVAFLESGGGWIAHWLERMDHHVKYWGHASAALALKPSEYFARQCFISTDPDEAILPGVLSVIGDDTIVFASDYPHEDAIFPGVVAALRDRKDLSERSKEKILSTNPARLYGLR